MYVRITHAEPRISGARGRFSHRVTSRVQPGEGALIRGNDDDVGDLTQVYIENERPVLVHVYEKFALWRLAYTYRDAREEAVEFNRLFVRPALPVQSTYTYMY